MLPRTAVVVCVQAASIASEHFHQHSSQHCCGCAALDNTELLNRMKAMEDRIQALEAEVQSLTVPSVGAMLYSERIGPRAYGSIVT